MERKELGFLAENIAARYLQERGYQIISRNYRRPWGEIDLIARRDGAIFFVEVKANQQQFTAADFAPEARADAVKMNKVRRTAALYMGQTEDPQLAWQIDVIAVTFDRANKKAKIKHFPNVTEDYS